MKKSNIIKLTKDLFRRIGGFVVLCCVLASLTVLFACSSIYKSAQLSAYERYYEATETLLDSLESRLNWMDATDPGPAYDNYIRARKKLRR